MLAPLPASWESSGQRSKLTVTSSLLIPVNKALSLTCSFFLLPVCVIRFHLSSDNKRCAMPLSLSLPTSHHHLQNEARTSQFSLIFATLLPTPISRAHLQASVQAVPSSDVPALCACLTITDGSQRVDSEMEFIGSSSWGRTGSRTGQRESGS